jgi:DNA-binding winged helix-turn-helix (wHTH) protein
MGHSKQSTGEVEVDLGRYELRRFGRRIRIEKKPMDLLIFLLERREQMVYREDIVKKLWRSDLFIDTEKNVNNIVRKLRTALGDNADKPRFLETVVGKGYRFVGQVRVIDAKYPISDPGQNSVRTGTRNDGSELGEGLPSPCCRCCCWRKRWTTKACVSGLRIRSSRSSAIYRAWTCCPLPQS